MSAYSAARAASHAQFSALQAAYAAQERANAAQTAPCPHCGIDVSLSNHARHVTRCLSDPARFAAHLAALDDGTGQCVQERVYTALVRSAPRGALLSAVQLCKRMPTNSWKSVGEFFGLRPFTASMAMLAANARRQAHTGADVVVVAEVEGADGADAAPIWAGQTPAAPRYLPDGVPVCRVTYEDCREVRWLVK